MDLDPISYNYKGETILIYPGQLFTKHELISRLKEMNFALVDDSYDKQDLVIIYEIATSYQKNIEKIITKLKKDDKYMKLKERLQKNNKMEPNNKSINSFFQNLKNKLLFSENKNASNSLNDDNEKNEEEKTDKEKNDNDSTISSNNSYIYSFSAYIGKKLLKLLGKFKYIFIKIVLQIAFYYIVKYYIENNTRSNLLGMLLKKIVQSITLKRYLILFLLIYIFRFITNSLITFLLVFFGIGIVLVFFKNNIPGFY